MNNKNYIKEFHKILNQFFKFGVVGFLGSSINFAVFFILFNYFNFNYIASGILGFIFPIPLVYFINAKWSFNYKKYSYSDILIYFVINVISLICHTFVLISLKSYVGLQEEFCQLSGIFISAIVNFLLLKSILFSKARP